MTDTFYKGSSQRVCCCNPKMGHK